MSFVLDCSMTMAWIFADESNEHTQSIQESLLDQDAVVPALWSIEVSNVILVATRRKRIKKAEWPELFERLKDLPIIQDTQSFSQVSNKCISLAHQHSLSVYDAVYLELAHRLKIPLASLDKKLKKAAQAIKIQVL